MSDGWAVGRRSDRRGGSGRACGRVGAGRPATDMQMPTANVCNEAGRFFIAGESALSACGRLFIRFFADVAGGQLGVAGSTQSIVDSVRR